MSLNNNNESLQNHSASAIAFCNSDDTLDKIKTTCRTTFKELVMGELPNESSLVTTLKIIECRLQKLQWNGYKLCV
jgi:hypothetical protein